MAVGLVSNLFVLWSVEHFYDDGGRGPDIKQISYILVNSSSKAEIEHSLSCVRRCNIVSLREKVDLTEIADSSPDT